MNDHMAYIVLNSPAAAEAFHAWWALKGAKQFYRWWKAQRRVKDFLARAFKRLD